MTYADKLPQLATQSDSVDPGDVPADPRAAEALRDMMRLFEEQHDSTIH